MTSDDPEQSPSRSRDELVGSAVARWRAELSGAGGPNTLLWYREGLPGALDLTAAHPAGVAKLLAGKPLRLSDIVRAPEAYSRAAQRAHAVHAKDTELQQEHGLLGCFLAIGMATWQRRGDAPMAPVLLKHAALRPLDETGADFDIAVDVDTVVNPVLLTYLRSAHGIDLDPDLLLDAAQTHHGLSPEAAYEVLRDQAAALPGLSVRSSLVVTTFPATKLDAVADLAEQADRLVDHDVVAALAGDRPALEQVRLEAPPPEGEPDLADELLVLDADASQASAVDQVAAGSHLAVLGAPGTGKSQTVANLVASLAARGRRVLLVSEQRAAIEAVTRRLEGVGLDELVLDTTRSPVGREPVARELVRTLERVVAEGPARGEPVPEGLVELRDLLAGHRSAMHDPREPWWVTADEAQARISELTSVAHPPRSRVRLPAATLAAVGEAERDEIADLLVEAAECGAWTTGEQPDPWFGAQVVGQEYTERARDLVLRLHLGGLAGHVGLLDDLAEQVGLRRPETVREADEQLELMSRVFSTLEVFRQEVFDEPLDDLVEATAPRQQRGPEGSSLGAVDRRRLRKQARSLLRPGRPPADLHGVLERAAGQKQRWLEMADTGSVPSAPMDVPLVQAEHEVFREELEWLSGRLEDTHEGGDLLDLPIGQLEERVARLADAQERLLAVPRTYGMLQELRRRRVGAVVDDFARRRLRPDQVRAELEFVWWSSVLAVVGAQDPRYGKHDGPALRQAVQTYREDDARHVAAGASRVRAAVEAQLAQVVRDLPEQVELLRVEGSKAQRHRAPRELLELAPELMTAVRPCWAASPLSVAATVPPGLWFDVVVLDGGSDIPTASAISAISRAEQVVVVGDDQQPSPRPLVVADGLVPPADGEPVESVLEALLPLVPLQELGWHHRARAGRLISFVGREIYGDRLTIVPEPEPAQCLDLDVVHGAIGDGETSEAEVRRVVHLVLAHAQQRPESSLGVVTLGDRHAQAVELAVRQALGDSPELAGQLVRGPEPFFVRPARRVPGQERDTVILSLGYGRGADGGVQYRFGEIDGPQGLQLLNVALTRARRRMTVVSSYGGQELNTERLTSDGARALREFLLFAAPDDGARTPPPANDVQVSPVVRELAGRLRSKGLVVHESHGDSRLPVDLVVEDPAQPGDLVLAVETDGLRYAGLASVRDRDRLRPQHLERLGWAVERVWTVDVFRDPARDVARIQQTLNRVSQERARARAAARRRPRVTS